MKIFIFVSLVVTVIISQIVILKPHLEYGFSDVDWGFLSIYKTQNPYSISQLINNFKVGGTRGGVYTHQIYYIGIQNELFGLNFKSFQITTHIFKTLAILASIPIFLAISGSLLVTVISTILFAFSYSAVGTMYTVVTSSDYSAIFALGIFVVVYWYAVWKNVGNPLILIASLLLLILTLFLSTERMYALPLFIVLAESFLIFSKGKLEKNTIKRILIILMPLFLIVFIKPAVFLSFFLDHGTEIMKGVSAGNWNLLLTPFIVLGSIVIPHNYTKFLGVANIDSFFSFLDFFLSGPFIFFTISTMLIGLTVFIKPLKFIFQTLFLSFIFSIILFITGSHFVNHLLSVESVIQALIGFYIMAIAIISFKYWTENKNRLYIGLFAGPFLAFIYIFLTWIGASTVEIFSGTHRYLTIPALFMSFFLGNLFVLMVTRLFNLLKKFQYIKFLAVTPLILLLIFININAKEIQDFFNGQLNNGFGAADKQIMRNQLLSYLDNLSDDKRSLIYFDFSQDNDNGYYYDNTLLGGLGSWILWHKRINFNEDLVPAVFWNNKDLLKASIVEENGKRGFLYNKTLFNLEDFYAFKLINKKVYNIKEELLLDLGI